MNMAQSYTIGAFCRFKSYLKTKSQDSQRANRLTTKDLSASEEQAGTKCTKESKDKALDSILELHDIEIDQKSYSNPCQLHVGQQLYFAD